MSYVKTQWVNGDTITADKLNHIEAGIEANENENSLVKSQLEAIQIVDTASGAVASFADGADGVPVRGLTVQIEPIQSGTGDPSPENVRPISGRTEVTVIRTGDCNNTGWTRNISVLEDGSVEAGAGTDYYCSPYIKATRIVYIDIQSKASGSRYFTMAAYDADKNFIALVRRGIISATSHRVESYDLPEGTAYICMSFGKGPNGTVNYVVGDYNPRFTIQLGDTIYGGTLNVTTGVLTVEWANIASYDGETLPGEWISDRDVYAPGTAPTTGAQVCYKLAEPLTVQLSAQALTTLLGLNNIWSDAGDVAVNYVADTKLYIEQLTAPDADMVADANITSGQYFMVGNNLYLATANIASGAAITPGVNCTRTSLAEALNAINA